jgi:pimeloyl-ACP methyl ester carboxylesterase
MSGFPAALKHGMPKSVWSATEIDYWKFIFLGLKVKSGFGNLADHKALYNIMSRVSFYNQDLFVPMEIEADDHLQGIPIREIVWGKNIYKQPDYVDSLISLESPTLILVGRHDPEAPVPCSEELDQGIPNSRMVIFEQSGHNPFLEEPELFIDEVNQFLNDQ